MNAWRVYTVDQIKDKREGAIAVGPFGSRMKADRYVASGVPVIRGNNLSNSPTFTGDFAFVSESTADELRSSNVFPGDLVFPHRGAIGAVGIVPEGGPARYMLSTSLMKLSCDRDLVDPLFLFYFFRSRDGRNALLARASTVGTPGIGQPLASLRSISIPTPPLVEQQAISEVLGALDKKIDLNRATNLTLDALGSQYFAAATEKADLVPLEQLVEVNPQRKLPIGVMAPYFDMKALPTQGALVEQGGVDRAAGSGSRFINGDTLLARITPCLENGKTAFVDCLPKGAVGWGSTEYIVLRPKPGLPEEFAYYLARSAAFRSHAIASMTGTSGRQRVQVDALAMYPTPRPLDDMAIQFAAAVRPLFRLMRSNANESRTLVDLRDALLPKLITGALRIKDVQQLVEDAV